MRLAELSISLEKRMVGAKWQRELIERLTLPPTPTPPPEEESLADDPDGPESP